MDRSEKGPRASLRIVSVNLWGGAMFDALGRWLSADTADVYCFQEVTRTGGLDGWTRFVDPDRSLPQRADLFADLCGLLPGHVGHFHPSDAGPVTAANGTAYRQDFGIGTFVSRRLELVAEATRFVHGSFIEHGDAWPEDGRPRIAHGIRVTDAAGERHVTVVQLHGLRDSGGKKDTPARLEQARRLAALVSEIREKDDSTVVCGDLNLLPDSETFTVLADVGLTDLVGWADTRTSRYVKPVRHASYLLVSHPQRVVEFDVVAEPEISDHRILSLALR